MWKRDPYECASKPRKSQRRGISQQQLGMLFRLGHVFARRLRCIMKRWPKLGPGLRTSEVLWDAFLRSLGTSMISAWMKDLEDWQPVSCQSACLCKTCSGSFRGHGARAAYQCHLYFRFWCRSPSTSSDASGKRSVLGFLGSLRLCLLSLSSRMAGPANLLTRHAASCCFAVDSWSL